MLVKMLFKLTTEAFDWRKKKKNTINGILCLADVKIKCVKKEKKGHILRDSE